MGWVMTARIVINYIRDGGDVYEQAAYYTLRESLPRSEAFCQLQPITMNA